MGIKSSIDSFIRVFIPSFYVLFLFCGFLAAIASGIIEYVIIDNIFYIDKKTNLLVSLIPLLIVIVFEVTKIFIIFYKEQLGDTDKSRKREVGILRWVFIIVSVLSTLMFTINKLENPNKDNVINEHKERIANIYNPQIDDIKKEIEDTKFELNKERSSGIGGRYKELAIERKEFNNILSGLYAEKQNEIQNIKVYSNDTQESDNRIISSFLSTIWKIFSGNNEYPRTIYYLFMIALSILISLGLEVVILTSVYVIYRNHSEALDFENFEEKSINFKPIIKYSIFSLVFMAGIVLSTKLENVNLILTMSSIGFFLFLMSRTFFSDGRKAKTNSKFGYLKFHIMPAVIGSIVPAVIAVIVTFSGADPSTSGSVYAIGISLASAFMGDKLSASVSSDTALA